MAPVRSARRTSRDVAGSSRGRRWWRPKRRRGCSRRTDAYFGLTLDVSSRLAERAGGTDLELTVETRWRSRHRLVQKVVERAILSGGEARKELTNLKTLIEREAVD